MNVVIEDIKEILILTVVIMFVAIFRRKVIKEQYSLWIVGTIILVILVVVICIQSGGLK